MSWAAKARVTFCHWTSKSQVGAVPGAGVLWTADGMTKRPPVELGWLAPAGRITRSPTFQRGLVLRSADDTSF